MNITRFIKLKSLCMIGGISIVFSGCAVLESFTACSLPKDITTRFETYKKETKNDEDYKKISALEYEWKKVFAVDDFYSGYTEEQRKEYVHGTLSEQQRKEHCAIATQAYKEVSSENPNILKSSGAGLEKILKAEGEYIKKVENRKIRKLDEKANKKPFSF